MLHPFMPFITEELWSNLGAKEPIMVSPWPHIQQQMVDASAEEKMEQIISIIVTIRNIRAEMNIPHKEKISAVISASNDDILALAGELEIYAMRLAGVEGLEIGKRLKRPKHSASGVLDFCEVSIPLEGVIDIHIERERLQRKLADLESPLLSLSKKLKNKKFVEKAPKDVVENEQQRHLTLKEKADKLRENIKNLT